MKIGFVIKLGITVEYLVLWVNVDMVLVMLVEFGFGGQKFMKVMLLKVY